MSTHIAADAGDIAESVLLPGDPLRAQFIAETFLDNPVCYTRVRNMLGFTGSYRGKRVSVQGTGMGQPSLSIYAGELFSAYGVRQAIRIGTCGAVQRETRLRSLVIAEAACSDSGIPVQRFGHLHYAPCADFSLLDKAYHTAEALALDYAVGQVASSDLFYDTAENWRLWAKYGVLGIEMETAELYTLAALHRRKALALLTVSDHLATGETTTAEERQTSFVDMIKLALELC